MKSRENPHGWQVILEVLTSCMQQSLTTPMTNGQKMVSARLSYDLSVDFCLLLSIVSTFSSEFLLTFTYLQERKQKRHQSFQEKLQSGSWVLVWNVSTSLSPHPFYPIFHNSSHFLLFFISAVLFKQQMIWTCLGTTVHGKCLQILSSGKFGLVSLILETMFNVQQGYAHTHTTTFKMPLWSQPKVL